MALSPTACVGLALLSVIHCCALFLCRRGFTSWRSGSTLAHILFSCCCCRLWLRTRLPRCLGVFCYCALCHCRTPLMTGGRGERADVYGWMTGEEVAGGGGLLWVWVCVHVRCVSVSASPRFPPSSPLTLALSQTVCESSPSVCHCLLWVCRRVLGVRRLCASAAAAGGGHRCSFFFTSLMCRLV